MHVVLCWDKVLRPGQSVMFQNILINTTFNVFFWDRTKDQSNQLAVANIAESYKNMTNTDQSIFTWTYLSTPNPAYWPWWIATSENDSRINKKKTVVNMDQGSIFMILKHNAAQTILMSLNHKYW